MSQQRISGILLILIAVGIVLMAAHGKTLEERNITGAVFLLPIGIVAIFNDNRQKRTPPTRRLPRTAAKINRNHIQYNTGKGVCQWQHQD